MFFLNPANHIRFFFCDIRVRYGPRILNVNSIPIGEILTKDFPVCVVCIT